MIERLDKKEENYSPEMKEYLSSLSRVQVAILNHLAEGYIREEIIEKLKITSSIYNDSLQAIYKPQNVRKLRQKIC